MFDRPVRKTGSLTAPSSKSCTRLRSSRTSWKQWRGFTSLKQREFLFTLSIRDSLANSCRSLYNSTSNRTRQYKTKIKEWGLDDKYIKTNEYIGILKEKRRLERDDPGRSYEFYLRGKHVEASSILRFESRATKRGLIQPGDSLSDRGKSLQTFPRGIGWHLANLHPCILSKESLGDELQYFPSDEAYAEDGEYDDYYGYGDASQSQYSSAYGYS